MILFALVLTASARPSALLAIPSVQVRLIVVTAVADGGVLAGPTAQALRGQSIVHPDGVTALCFGSVCFATAASSLLVLWHARRRLVTATPTHRRPDRQLTAR